MCLYPKLIKNRKYVANKKNGGNVPTPTDDRTLMVPVGCGRCIECSKQKARQWQVRLQEEVRNNNNGIFVTLTFSNESIAELTKAIYEENGGVEIEGYELDNQIATLAIRRFTERWRKKYKETIRHWCVTEIGGNRYECIHIHGILFPKKEYKIKKEIIKLSLDDAKKEINNIWKYGYTYCGDYVSNETINYISKYFTKRDKKHCNFQPKILNSKGIGKGYIKRLDSKLNKYVEGGKTKETYTTREGVQINLPIYYRNKIYTENEREKLWIEKLDKQERWICGEKVDISTEKGLENYFKLLKYYRAKNKQLGYGNDEVNWEKKNYENQLRNLKIKERINNVQRTRNNKNNGMENGGNTKNKRIKKGN